MRTLPFLFCLALLCVRQTSAADSQFTFDVTGNLASQTAASTAPPQIVSPPQWQIVQPGQLASFSVVVADTRGVTYQWLFNGTNLAGATTDAFVVTNAGLAHQGQYAVVASNSSGSVTSAPAMLWIDSDADGMADSWELTYFTNLNQYAYGDLDSDGVFNADEFREETNPTNRASALYRITISADGGTFTFSPSKLKYTNGEVVTVTATPVGSEIFHGWTGDALGTNNQIMLTMTTNRFVTAYFHYYTIYWTNTANSADWHGAQNWSPNLVPAKGDTVVFTLGNSVANSPAECGTLILGGSGISTSIGGSSTITVHSNGVWGSGSMMGPGRTIIGSNATFTINGAVNINGRTLDNAGTILRLGTGTTTMWANSILTNRPGALIEIQDTSFFSTYIGPARVDNAGTIRKTVSNGVAYFAGDHNGICPLNNYGAVEIDTGTLVLEGGGFNYGTITVPAGCTLQLARTDFSTSPSSTITGGGNFVCGAGGTFSGYMNLAGSHTFTGGTINFNGNFLCTNNAVSIATGTVNFNSTGLVAPRFLTLASGNLAGSGTVTVLEQMTWSGGGLAGGGRLIIASNATMTINHPGATQVFMNRVIDNAGTIDWLASSTAFMSTSVITNRPGALFHVQSTPTIVSSQFTVNRIDNAGTFRKSVSAGQLAMENLVAFNNYGTAEVQIGTWRLAGGGSSRGNIDLAPGTSLTHAGNTFDWNGSGSLNGTGDLLLTGGLVNFNGNFFSTNNNVTISSSANAHFIGTGTLANVSFSGANIAGGGVLNVLTQMTWTAGSMSGGGRTVIGSNATLTINQPTRQSLGRVLDNAGTVLWVSPSDVFLSNATITNRPGALFEIRNNQWFLLSGSTVNRFDNAGTFRKLIGTGQTVFDNTIAFNNYGEVDLQTGHLIAVGGGLNSGNINVAAAAALEFRGIYTVRPGAQMNGSGLYKIASGTFTLNADVTVQNVELLATLDGSGRLTINNVLNWNAGTMGGSGRTIIVPGATNYINNTSATVLLLGRTFENAGTVIWTGGDSYNIQVGNGGAITNCAGAVFEVRNNGSFYPFPGNARFDNAGVLRKVASTGTTRFDANNSFGTVFPFNNYGTLEIRSGIVLATSGFTSRSDSLLHCFLAGTAAGTGYGRFQANGALTLNGALRVSLTNGFIPAENDTFTVVTAGSRSGAFTSFTYPSNIVAMQLSNSTTSVILRVTDITLTNGAPVIINDLPVAQLFYDGRTLSLPTRVAGGQPFTFQWQKDGTDLTNSARIAGANASTLFVTNALREFDSGNYRLLITNAEGSATTRVSAVNIQAVPKFNASGAGWTLQGTTMPPMNTNTTTLTSGLGSTARSVFYNAPLYIASFLAQFVYVDVGGGGADGITFCIHNHPGAPAVVGGGGGGLGYAGITPSAALALNIYQPNTRGMSWRTNGTLPFPNPYNPIGAVNLASGNPIHITLLYTGGVLKVSFVESNTANTFTTNLNVNIPAMVGGETAYVGFTGGDGGVGSTQVISNFTFVPITRVAVEVASTELALSWPASVGGYRAEGKTSLGSTSAVWIVSTNRIEQTPARNRATVPGTNNEGYFRIFVNPAE